MFEQAFKNLDDVLRKEAGCTTELDYTEQTSWLLFLKYLDGLEQDKATEAALDGKKYSYIIDHIDELRFRSQTEKYELSQTAYLFLKHYIKILKAGGRAGVVIK